jgi:predicted dehydrogenase
MLRFLIVSFIISIHIPAIAQNETLKQKPLRVVVVGLVHDHVGWILGYQNKNNIEVVGIAEPNRSLAEKYSKRYGYSMSIVYNTIEEAIEKTKPEAVLAFNNIYEHLKVVEYCAPRGIHVMVEKPLAVSNEHVTKMLTLAKNIIFICSRIMKLPGMAAMQRLTKWSKKIS